MRASVLYYTTISEYKLLLEDFGKKKFFSAKQLTSYAKPLVRSMKDISLMLKCFRSFEIY